MSQFMIEPPSIEKQIKRQVEQWLLDHSYDHGDRVISVRDALTMCIELNKHLTELLDHHEKLAMERFNLRMDLPEIGGPK